MQEFQHVIQTVFVTLMMLPWAMHFGTVTSQAQKVSPELVAQLQSDDPLERSRGYYQLLRTPAALSDPETPGVILDLAERENRLIESTLRESNGVVGVSGKYGEGYGEYYSQLLTTLQQLGDLRNDRVLNALAKSAYNPDSAMAVQLAKQHGGRIILPVLEMSRSDLSGFRQQAIGMLDTIFEYNSKLPSAVVSKIRAAIIEAASDKSVGVRQLAVRALGNIGSTGDLSLLESIGQNDSESYTTNGGKTQRFPVREEARKAIDKIRSKAIR